MKNINIFTHILDFININSYLLFNLTLWSQPLPVKLKHTIIIDTDCAIDDMRAISLLLSRPEITIKAILLSDGTLPPNEGYGKINALLKQFNTDNIQVACGENLKGVNPPWREFNRQISWGKEQGSQAPELNAVECLGDNLKNANEKQRLHNC